MLGCLISAGLLRPKLAGAAPSRWTSANPLVWVWKFSVDGPLGPIRDTLAANGLGIILKTHDGTEWMQRFDDSPDAITGPAQVARLAGAFEQAGVPFHAWCVPKGQDPIGEARMCSDVLNSGARSLYLDLEPPDGGGNYWQGTWEDALRFGEELRRLQPHAWVTVAPDVRPWQGGHVPLAEFASFSNAIAPQAYWATFDGPTNRRYFSEHGYFVGPEGVTPELIVDVSIGTFQHFGRPIQPIGQGASPGHMWHRFVTAANARGLQPISLWRYGTADPGAFEVLKFQPPQPPPPEPEPVLQDPPPPPEEPPPPLPAPDIPERHEGDMPQAALPQSSRPEAQWATRNGDLPASDSYLRDGLTSKGQSSLPPTRLFRRVQEFLSR